MKPPIIIVGAGRSGTKMLRGILAANPSVVCFPREINYIWRHGNARHTTDELRPEHARPQVIDYVRRRFERLSRKHNDARVIEKTCASALRVDFVRAVFPEAHVIHLVRDGRAVAESARRCWQGYHEPGYLLEKARWVPPSDIPYYALRYLRYQLGRLRSAERVQSSWGPRFTGLDELIASKTLIEVCGLQWKACVQAADVAMRGLPTELSITVRYEDLVGNPMSVVQDISRRIDLPFTEQCCAYIGEQVHQDNVSKWQKRLSDEDLRLLMPHISSMLSHFGYAQ